MIHHFKVFAEVDPGNNWQGLIDATYKGQLEVVNQQAVPNGLLPDFIRVNRTTGVWWTQPGRLLETPEDGDYHWNACRVPWRQAMDVMFSKDTPISDPIVKLLNANQFVWAEGDFTKIHGRKMDGTANTLANGFSYDVGGSAFSGPALVPAAIYGPQAWFDNGWDWARNYQWRGDKYGDYLTVLAMLAASGNEWSPVVVYTPPEPPTEYAGTSPSQLNALLAQGDVMITTPGSGGYGIAAGATLVVPEGKTLYVSTILNVRRDATLQINGTVVILEGGRLNSDGHATSGTGKIIIASGGKLINEGYVEIAQRSVLTNGGTITNNGTTGNLGRFEVRAGVAFTRGIVDGTRGLTINRDAVIS